jgi:cytochrome c
MKSIVFMAIAAGALSFASAHAADVAHGKAVFQAQCAACHSVDPGQNGIGPSLAGVYGKPAASVPGFRFSPALKHSKIVWTSEALNKFIENPQIDVPGTKMPYMGMSNATNRADVIAYLATLKGK